MHGAFALWQQAVEGHRAKQVAISGSLMPGALTDNRSADTTATAVAERPSALAAVEKAAAASETVSSTASPSAPGTGSSPAASTPAAKSPAAVETTGKSDSEELRTRFEAAARNARQKAEEEFKGKFGWAESLDRAKVERAMQIMAAIDKDAKAFHAQLGSELTAIDPNDPEPDLRSADGRPAYSADLTRAIVTNAVNRAVKELRTEINPALSFTQEERDRRARDELVHRAQQTITEIVSDARETYPWMKSASVEERQKQEQGILEIITQLDPALKAKLGAAGTFHRAASVYYHTKIAPAKDAQAESNVLTDLQRKAAASTGTAGAPGPVVSTAVKRPDGPDALARHLAATYPELSNAS